MQRLIDLGYPAFNLASVSGAGNYAVYTALVSQRETDNPTVIELVNTLGITITWTREATGDYKGTPSTSFADIDKIWFPSGVSNQGDEFVVSSVVQSVSDIRLYVIDGGSLVDGLENFPIEIRIYS